MRAKFTASAVLLILPLIVIGLVACGTDSGVAASQAGDAVGDAPSVSITDEAHTDEDAYAVALADEHDDGDQHAVNGIDSHDSEATALAEHDETPHSDMVSDTHEDELTEAHGHMEMDGRVDPDAPVMHVFASEFSYDTATSEVEAGQPFSIQIHNEGNLEHDITFVGLESEFGLHVQPGEDNIATWAIDQPGEYLYYCTVLGHREAGMTGTLIVTGAFVDEVHGKADGHHEDEAVLEDEGHDDDASDA
ncbi:MAG: cupredoxin domain-containing protein [Chloroflexi bacterium]|nr:cupredoxin domain-containing protein [Chloroflexota bacterium]